MKIISTRSKTSLGSHEAILKGLSSDGGLFVFDRKRPLIYNPSMATLSYQELAVHIISKLFDDYDIQAIHQIVTKAYSADYFKNDIVGIKSFDDCAYLELYHGPTFSFKDMALSVLPLLVKEAKHEMKDSRKTVILTATSGDTGSAALSGFSQDDNTLVFVLYPQDGISEFQELQMNQYQSEKYKIFGIDGNFDDCQNIVKRVFKEVHPSHVSLSSANSINIGRLVPQIVYYFYSYLTLVKEGKVEEGDAINVCVPTGNFGNIYAAYLAKEFGVPIDKLIVASNKNHVLTDLFHTGIYNSNRDFSISHSPSMDILISSNIERYIFDLYHQDDVRVKELMDDFTSRGSVEIKEILNQRDFTSEYATETETLAEIKRVFDERNYLIDPHTAVASCVSRKIKERNNDNTYTLIVSTASPYKFSSSICEALDIKEASKVRETIENISARTGTVADARMVTVLSSNSNKRSMQKASAFEELKRMIGEIDA